MAEHSVTVTRHEKFGGAMFYRWRCSCGRVGKGSHGYPGHAEAAGRNHAAVAKTSAGPEATGRAA